MRHVQIVSSIHVIVYLHHVIRDVPNIETIDMAWPTVPFLPTRSTVAKLTLPFIHS